MLTYHLQVTEAESAALWAMAERECREARGQARMIIRERLEDEGFLEGVIVSHLRKTGKATGWQRVSGGAPFVGVEVLGVWLGEGDLPVMGVVWRVPEIGNSYRLEWVDMEGKRDVLYWTPLPLPPGELLHG